MAIEFVLQHVDPVFAGAVRWDGVVDQLCCFPAEEQLPRLEQPHVASEAIELRVAA